MRAFFLATPLVALALGGPGCATGGTLAETGDDDSGAAGDATIDGACDGRADGCGGACLPPRTICGGPDAGHPGDASIDGSGDASAQTPDSGPAAPYCADLSADPDNCGACRHACGKDHSCRSGNCTIDCPNGSRPCVAGDTCIPPGTCCSSADCTAAGQVCPSPGSQCGCPSGERLCTKSGACISSNDCCTDSDCPAQGSTCPAPGASCQCPGGPNPLGGSCAAATAKGPIALGQSIQVQGNLATKGAQDWIAVTFGGDSNDKTYHPSVTLSGGSAGEFVFDVYAACGGALLTCGDGGNCSGKTTWETAYGAQATGQAGQPNWQPVPAVGTAYVRVYRAAASVTCDPFTLTLGD